MKSFTQMHNDHLDPDLHLNCEDGEEKQEEGGIWTLHRWENGKRKPLGIFETPDGKDAWGSDMSDWMVEEGHYGDFSPDDYEFEGDSEHVAIMGKRKGVPDFSFSFIPYGEGVEVVLWEGKTPIPGSVTFEKGDEMTDLHPTFERNDYDDSFPVMIEALEFCPELHHGFMIDIYDELKHDNTN